MAMILMLKSAVTAHKIYGLFHDLWLLCSVGQILPLRRTPPRDETPVRRPAAPRARRPRNIFENIPLVGTSHSQLFSCVLFFGTGPYYVFLLLCVWL